MRDRLRRGLWLSCGDTLVPHQDHSSPLSATSYHRFYLSPPSPHLEPNWPCQSGLTQVQETPFQRHFLPATSTNFYLQRRHPQHSTSALGVRDHCVQHSSFPMCSHSRVFTLSGQNPDFPDRGVGIYIYFHSKRAGEHNSASA